MLGSASSGHHRGNSLNWPAKLLRNPVALQGMLFQAKARPTAYNCGWRQQGHAAITYMLQQNLNEDANKSFGPQQPLNGQGVLRILGLKIQKEKVGVRFGSWNVGSISGRETEMCEKLRKRKVGVCCLQEVRWRGEGARFFGVEGRRYKLWWCGNDDKTGGVSVLVKEELCENVAEVRRCDRVMAIGLVFKEEAVC